MNMLVLDNRTLLFVLVFVGVIVFFFSLFASRKIDKRSIRIYQLSNVIYVLAFGLLLTQELWDPFVSIIIANNLIFTAFLLFSYTCLRLYGIKVNKMLYFVLAAFNWACFLLLTYIWPNTLFRIIVISAEISFVLLHSIYLVSKNYHEVRKESRGVRTMFFATQGMYLLVSLFRIGFTLMTNLKIQSIFTSDIATTIIFLATISYQVSINLVIFLRISHMFEHMVSDKITLLESTHQDIADINNFYISSLHNEKAGRLYYEIMQFIKNRFGVDAISLFLLNKAENQLIHKYVDGLSGKLAVHLSKAVEKHSSLTYRAVHTSKPQYLPVDDYEHPETRHMLSDAGFVELYSFPLITRHGAIGALTIAMKHHSEIFFDETSFFELICNQVAAILENSEMYENLNLLASKDSLTGILNRRTFNEKAEEGIIRSRRYQQKSSFIMLDIDHFKSYNDRYGHDLGDQVIINLTEVIGDLLRETDLFGRFGGEEFVIFLENADVQAANEIAERIRVHIAAQKIPHNGEDLSYTISLGVTGIQFEDEVEDIINRADQALYNAKESGRNRVVFA